LLNLLIFSKILGIYCIIIKIKKPASSL